MSVLDVLSKSIAAGFGLACGVGLYLFITWQIVKLMAWIGG